MSFTKLRHELQDLLNCNFKNTATFEREDVITYGPSEKEMQVYNTESLVKTIQTLHKKGNKVRPNTRPRQENHK
jgi:hypothetical protein